MDPAGYRGNAAPAAESIFRPSSKRLISTAGKQNSYQPPRPVKSERFFHGKEVKMADPRSPPQGDFARNVSKLWEMITNGS